MGGAQVRAAPTLLLDMVHHNPGESRYETPYEDPQVIRAMGDNGKVFFLFGSPLLAVNWESADPEIFPQGSPGRTWIDAKAMQLDARHAACKSAGLKVYAMSDLILLPKRLVEKFHLAETFGDPRQPETQKYLRLLIVQMFDRFPQLDGLVVRIGETYLHDAPHHVGAIKNKTSANETIIPPMQLLREEVCVRRGKEVIFRTWLSFDTKLETYEVVSAAVEPHANLVISIKHCEGDFHRANLFSKVLGAGRHRQIIEVQCARESEGKGAYRIYRANVQLAHANSAGDQQRIAAWLADYDQAWVAFRRLPQEHPSCATLYQEKGTPWGPKPGVDELIRECPGKLSARP